MRSERMFLPQMVSRGHRRVLKIASMAGFVPVRLQVVYYASKAFFVSFSEAIANELAGTGVAVTVLCPGPTGTEFAQRPEMKGVRLQQWVASARAVAETTCDAMLEGKTVVVPGILSKFVIHGLLRLSPRKRTTGISLALMRKNRSATPPLEKKTAIYPKNTYLYG